MLRSHKKLSYLDNLPHTVPLRTEKRTFAMHRRRPGLTLIRSVLSFGDIFCVLCASGFAQSVFAGYNDL